MTLTRREKDVGPKDFEFRTFEHRSACVQNHGEQGRARNHYYSDDCSPQVAIKPRCVESAALGQTLDRTLPQRHLSSVPQARCLAGFIVPDSQLGSQVQQGSEAC